MLWPDFTLLALAGFLDSLRLAADIGDRGQQKLCRWHVMTDDNEPISSSCGVKVAPTAKIGLAPKLDYVAVVAGHTSRIEDRLDRAEAFLKKAGATKVPLIGICTGTFILARLGLAKNKRVCLANYHYREFAERFPEVAIVHDQLWHQDGDLITCAGGTAAIDLAGHLLSSRFGEDRRLKIGKLTMASGLRAPSAPQWPSASRASPIQEIRISRALSLMEQYTASPISMREIADKVGITGKQLERLFKLSFNETPARFYKRLRLQCGHWMLQNSRATIAQIAFDCGFFDHSHFTKAFEARYGFPPSLLRREGQFTEDPKVTSIPSRPPA